MKAYSRHKAALTKLQTGIDGKLRDINARELSATMPDDKYHEDIDDLRTEMNLCGNSLGVQAAEPKTPATDESMQLSRQISHVAGPTDAEKKAAKGALFGAMGIAGGVL